MAKPQKRLAADMKPPSGAGAKAFELTHGITTVMNNVARKRKCDNFVTAKIQGMSNYNAAIYAGVKPEIAGREGAMLAVCPYVRDRMHKTLELLEEDQIITRKRVILGFVRESERDGAGSSHAGRVAALTGLSKIMGYDQPTVIQVDVEHRGNVMMVPAPAPPPPGLTLEGSWEERAIRNQMALTHDSAEPQD